MDLVTTLVLMLGIVVVAVVGWLAMKIPSKPVDRTPSKPVDRTPPKAVGRTPPNPVEKTPPKPGGKKPGAKPVRGQAAGRSFKRPARGGGCDLCTHDRPVTCTYTSDAVRAAAARGHRPSTMHRADQVDERMDEDWLRELDTDETDWRACGVCERAVDSRLSGYRRT